MISIYRSLVVGHFLKFHQHHQGYLQLSIGQQGRKEFGIGEKPRYCKTFVSSNFPGVVGGEEFNMYEQTLCVHAATDGELEIANNQLHDGLIVPVLGSSGKCEQGSVGNSKQRKKCVLEFCCNDVDATSACGTFDPSTFYSTLSTKEMGRVLMRTSESVSTQSIVQENVPKLPQGAVIVSDRQVGGRGRSGNVWDSPDGCLMFSIGYKLSISGARLPFIQYLVTLAVVEASQAAASESLGLRNGSNPLNIRIKWPNDVYVGSLKLGGILCNTCYRDHQFHLTIGIGINVSNSTPTTCLNDLVLDHVGKFHNREMSSDVVSSPPPIRRERLLAGILNLLERMLNILVEEGFEPFQHQYYSYWLHSQQKVVVQDESTGPIEVTIIGLSQSGYLLAEDDEGHRHELHPDGNSLDFFKGLIRRKLNA